MSYGYDDYELQEIIAVQWNNQLAQRFPNTSHHDCRQSMIFNHIKDKWEPFNPPLCHDWHCQLCGKPCNVMGHHQCDNPIT